MNKNDNILDLVKILSDENEKLKEENFELKSKLNFYNESHEDDLSYIKETMKEAIFRADEAKKEYKNAVKELSKIKKQYQYKMELFLKQIKQ